MNQTQKKATQIPEGSSVFTPEIFPAGRGGSAPELLTGLSGLYIVDTFTNQVGELIRIEHPDHLFTPEELHRAAEDRINDPAQDQGNWVYYPWLSTVVRLLGEPEYVALRTSRNQFKITPEEQEVLAGKTVGVIGLSVGQAAAVTMAMERTGGILRLADYDVLDLSNLNRLRAGVHQLGLTKTVIAARQIAELDPYLKVEIYPEGITLDNMQAFMTGLDLVVEECDSLPVKISVRRVAQKMRLPVIMDTSDRGMVDVERFDIEPERPILHGKMEPFEHMNPSQFTAQDKQNILFSLVDYEKTSVRARESFAQIGKRITTWPQLASAVNLGGALMADTARRILLGNPVQSGRYYVDIEELIG